MSDPLGLERSPAVLPSTDMEDAALVARIRAGDESAFDRLFTAYYGRLCVFAERYVGGRTEAEDIVMDVWQRCWELRDRWEVQGTVRSYLYRAVANAASNAIRNQAGRVRLLLRNTWDTEPPPGMSTNANRDLAYQSDLTRAIQQGIRDLPPRCRLIFQLKWEHGLSYQEIADSLDISIKTVEMQLTRAARALRPRLEAYR